MPRPDADTQATDRITLYPFWGRSENDAPKLAPGRQLTLEHTADAAFTPEVIVPSDGLDLVEVCIGSEPQRFVPVELPMSVHGLAGFTLRGFRLMPGDRGIPTVRAGQRFAVVVRNLNLPDTADIPVSAGVLGNVQDLFMPARRAR